MADRQTDGERERRPPNSQLVEDRPSSDDDDDDIFIDHVRSLRRRSAPVVSPGPTLERLVGRELRRISDEFHQVHYQQLDQLLDRSLQQQPRQQQQRSLQQQHQQHQQQQKQQQQQGQQHHPHQDPELELQQQQQQQQNYRQQKDTKGHSGGIQEVQNQEQIDHTDHTRQNESMVFSQQFSTGGGELKNPSSDVVLTVPAGAVPPGECWTVCVQVHTDLMSYSEWLEPTEYIMGPVVECTVDSNKHFLKPVTVAIPLCTAVDNISDIIVLYSTGGGPFQGVCDRMGIHIRDSFVYVETYHFTKFLVKGRKPKKITEVVISLRAAMEFSRFENRVELRLLTHVNCHGMKDFNKLAHQTYDRPDMKEIDRWPVRLPKGEKPLNFPRILIDLEIKDEYQDAWDIWRHGKKATEEIDGSVLNVDPSIHGTEYLCNFVLESKKKWEETSFVMGVTFKYENNIHDWRHAFVRTYGSSRESRESEGSVCGADAAATADNPNNNSHAPRGDPTNSAKHNLTHDGIKTLLINHTGDIYNRLELSPRVIAALRKANVITEDTKNELAAVGITPNMRINIVLETVQRKGVAAFLNFCHVLCQEDIGQQHLVTDVLGLNIRDLEKL